MVETLLWSLGIHGVVVTCIALDAAMTRAKRPTQSAKAGRKSRRDRPEVRKAGRGRTNRQALDIPRRSLPKVDCKQFSLVGSLPYLIVVSVVSIVAFLPAVSNEFVHWDDYDNLVKNTHIRSLSGKNLEWMATSHLMGVWQPLTWFITAIEYAMFGSDGSGDLDAARFSRGIHIANIVFHSLACILCFFLARKLMILAAPSQAVAGPIGVNVGAAVAALLFAAHPLRVETVAWASAQPYILSVIGGLACVFCYLKGHETGRLSWQILGALCLAGSLLCKSITVPLVAVLFVLDVYPLRRFGGAAGWRSRAILRAVVQKIPHILITVGLIGLTIWATAENKTYRPDPFLKQLLIGGYCSMFYVSMTFVPVNLAPYYMRPLSFDYGDLWFIGATIACATITLALFFTRRRYGWLLAVWISYLILLSPNLGFIRHGGQMAADRYSYLSCVGWVVLVGAGVRRLWSGGSHVRRVATILVSVAAIVGLATMTTAYCRTWHDSVSLWSAMVERNPRFHMGYYNLAKAYKRGKKKDEAERIYRKAIELYPNYPEANVDLGNMLLAAGELDAARERYETALRGRPGFHMAYLNLGSLMLKKKNPAEAVRYFELAAAGAEKARDTSRLKGIRTKLERARKQALQQAPRAE